MLELREERSQAAAAAWTARRLASSVRGEIAVLARTTRLLRTVAEACVQPSIKISAPAEVFESRGALEVIRAHLQLAAHPHAAAPEQVLSVMRHPSRGLPLDGEAAVAGALRSGLSWTEALRSLGGPRGRLADVGAVLDAVHAIQDAARFVHAVRTQAGLDRHFEEYDRAFGGTEQTALESLEDCQREAKGLSVAQYADRLREQHDALQAIRDDEHGIELTTVHRAKGREWPTVIIFAFDDEQLPHKRALDVTAEQRAAGEGLEAERRIAYVAMTRAKDALHVLTTSGKMSPFAWQAGLAAEPQPPRPTPAPPRSRRGENVRRVASAPTGARRASSLPRDLAAQIEAISRVGAKYAVRTAADEQTGLRVAAWAIRHRLVNADNVAGTTTARVYLSAIPDIASEDVDELLTRTGVDPDAVVSRLPARQRSRLADALEAAAARTPR